MAPIRLFSQIIEQHQAKEMLRRAVAGAKLAHAYLFRGPAGVGKKSAAHALAAALNCRQLGPQLEACGRCPSCRKFASGNHPDFLEIRPQGAAIKIQQVREVKKALNYPPLEAGYRVVLLAEIHTMRREAANSLLKTLEEPPADTIFILTGDEAGSILPTILSRCQIIPFFPLSVEQLAARLSDAADLTPEAAATLAAVAEGSLGRARMLQEQDLLELRRQTLAALLDHQPADPAATPALLDLAERCAALKDDLPDFLDLLASCFHDLAILAATAGDHPAPPDRAQLAPPDLRPVTGNQPPPLINRDLADLLQRGSRRWNPVALDRRLEGFRRANSQLKRNCNRTLICEVLFFDLL